MEVGYEFADLPTYQAKKRMPYAVNSRCVAACPWWLSPDQRMHREPGIAAVIPPLGESVRLCERDDGREDEDAGEDDDPEMVDGHLLHVGFHSTAKTHRIGKVMSCWQTLATATAAVMRSEQAVHAEEAEEQGRGQQHQRIDREHGPVEPVARIAAREREHRQRANEYGVQRH